MIPEQLAKAGTEHAHQTALMCWAATAAQVWPEIKLLHAIPNGGERNIAVASRLKAEGVKSGVPDLCLPVARHGFHGLYVEMKKVGGMISENQGNWHRDLTAQGYCVGICWGWEEARDLITRYLTK